MQSSNEKTGDTTEAPIISDFIHGYELIDAKPWKQQVRLKAENMYRERQ